MLPDLGIWSSLLDLVASLPQTRNYSYRGTRRNRESLIEEPVFGFSVAVVAWRSPWKRTRSVCRFERSKVKNSDTLDL